MNRLLIALGTILVLVLCGIGIVAPRMEKRLLEPPANWPGGKYVLLEVKEGASAAQTAADLAKRGLIRSARAFTKLLKQHKWEGKLKPGVYKIEPESSSEQIARKLVEHGTFDIKVTIPEGLTLKQIGERVGKAGALEGEQWLPTQKEIVAAATSALFRKETGLRISAKSAEGYLFPATYTFKPGATAEQIVGRMMEEFAKRFTLPNDAPLRRSRMTLHEIVTLAAIVEREAEVDKERALIAQVFINRLRIGMKLQSCATVQYALPKHKAKLSIADTRVKSPYNTYLHKGLPPGPICSPGLASLQAALKPQKTDALYFVAKGDGTHSFSRTFAEHEQAKAGRQ